MHCRTSSPESVTGAALRAQLRRPLITAPYHAIPESPHILPSLDADAVEERQLNEVCLVAEPAIAHMDLNTVPVLARSRNREDFHQEKQRKKTIR